MSPEKREAVTKKQGNVTMPNPRIQFRIPTELFEQLPSNPNERSHLLKRLLEEYYSPKNPESDLAEPEGQGGGVGAQVSGWSGGAIIEF